MVGREEGATTTCWYNSHDGQSKICVQQPRTVNTASRDRRPPIGTKKWGRDASLAGERPVNLADWGDTHHNSVGQRASPRTKLSQHALNITNITNITNWPSESVCQWSQCGYSRRAQWWRCTKCVCVSPCWACLAAGGRRGREWSEIISTNIQVRAVL